MAKAYFQRFRQLPLLTQVAFAALLVSAEGYITWEHFFGTPPEHLMTAVAATLGVVIVSAVPRPAWYGLLLRVRYAAVYMYRYPW